MTFGYWKQGVIPLNKNRIESELGYQLETKLLNPERMADELCDMVMGFIQTTQIARNMCDMREGCLLDKRDLIHDRNPVFNKRIDMIFQSIGIEIKKLPPFAPIMNSRMENFIRAIKTECLDKIIFTNELERRVH